MSTVLYLHYTRRTVSILLGLFTGMVRDFTLGRALAQYMIWRFRYGIFVVVF